MSVTVSNTPCARLGDPIKVMNRPFLLCFIGISIGVPCPPTTFVYERVDKEVYEIYSILLRNQQTTDDDTPLLIAESTLMEPIPKSCFRVPSSSKPSFAEVLADHERRKEIQAKLQPRLKGIRPYRLLTDEEVHRLLTSKSTQSADFPVTTSKVFQFSDVYFNRSRNY